MTAAPATRVVLVVDDDAQVRSLLVRWAHTTGMHAIVADGGEDALLAFADHPEIDAVITDVAMPGLDGPTLATRLRAMRPSLPLVFISGFTGLTENPDVQLRPRVTFVAKPFSLQALSAALAAVLVETA